MTLTCPKCQGDMRTYERNGVHVDQCTECRGIFLDRGELERLVDAEASYHDTPAPAAPAASSGSAPSPGAGGLGAVVGEVLQQAKAAQHSSSGYGHRPSGHSRRKKSLIGELFG